MKILGISCYYHDSAAALIDDGKIIAASEEERFSRIKHDSSFPKMAVDFVLNFANLKIEDIDYVVFYEKPFLKFERINLTIFNFAPSTREQFVSAYRVWLKQKLWIKAELISRLKVASNKILFSQHHLSHAASSYYTSPFSSAAVLTCDGVGEWATTTWGRGAGSKLELQKQINFPNSLGLFYSTFTQFLGFEINEGEFKVMGLAPYGKPRFVAEVEKLIKQSSDGSFELNMKYFNFHISESISYNQKFIDLFKVLPMDPRKSDQVVQIYADIAASAQVVLEEKLLKIAKMIKSETQEKNLCLSGGVALNGVANWRIFKDAGFDNIFIHPAAGDSGGAVGAALYVYYSLLNNPRVESLDTIYLGRENSQDEVERFLKKNKIKAKKLSNMKLVSNVVDMLTSKKVIGWVRGRFEWGPRALGARSILADPRDGGMKDLVNSKIKFREGFRPFAPVVIYEKGQTFFDVGSNKSQPQILEYMLGVVPVNKSKRKKLQAITHVDGTARPQFIKKQKNPLYHEVVKEFGEATGIPVLLNTSFNLKGEPIVNTCENAFDTFSRSGIDALVLENYLITK